MNRQPNSHRDRRSARIRSVLLTAALTAFLSQTALLATAQTQRITIGRDQPFEYKAKDEIQEVTVANSKLLRASTDPNDRTQLRLKALGEAGVTEVILHLAQGQEERLQVEVVVEATTNPISDEVIRWRERLSALAPGVVVRGSPEKNPDEIEISGMIQPGDQEKAIEEMKRICAIKNIPVVDLTRKETQPEKMPRNVFVDVWLYLVTDTDMKNFGFNYDNLSWNATGGIAGTFTRSWGDTGQSSNKTVTNSGQVSGGIRGTVNHLAALANSKQLDHQMITVIEGQKANKQFGGTVFLENITQDTSTRTEVPFGTILTIIPTAMSEQRCRMDIEVESSTVADRPTPDSEFTKMVDKTTQQVMLDFGEPFLMANTFKNLKTKSTRGVIGLEKIPLLGELFKSRDFQEGRQEALLVVLAQLDKRVQMTPPPVLPDEAKGLLGGKQVNP